MIKKLLSFVFLLVLGLYLAAKIPKPTPDPVADRAAEQAKADAAKHGDEFAARVEAQRLIEKILKHPLDASFSWSSNARLSDPYGPKGLRNWIVSGTVKAPNDFGAELTKPYQVTLYVDGNQWHYLIAYLDNQIVYQDSANIDATVKALRSESTTADFPKSAAAAPAAAQKSDNAEAVRKSIEANRKGPVFDQRPWNVKGASVVGTLKSFGGGKVRIETADGKLLELTDADLSAADLQFIRDGLR
jgi:hypothetical protein